jgi:hypothetical protein
MLTIYMDTSERNGKLQNPLHYLSHDKGECLASQYNMTLSKIQHTHTLASTETYQAIIYHQLSLASLNSSTKVECSNNEALPELLINSAEFAMIMPNLFTKPEWGSDSEVLVGEFRWGSINEVLENHSHE